MQEQLEGSFPSVRLVYLSIVASQARRGSEFPKVDSRIRYNVSGEWKSWGKSFFPSASHLRSFPVYVCVSPADFGADFLLFSSGGLSLSLSFSGEKKRNVARGLCGKSDFRNTSGTARTAASRFHLSPSAILLSPGTSPLFFLPSPRVFVAELSPSFLSSSRVVSLDGIPVSSVKWACDERPASFSRAAAQADKERRPIGI